MNNLIGFISLMASITLVACSSEETPAAEATPALVNLTAQASTQRWYSDEQVAQGQLIFAQYCTACHGVNAEGTEHWKTPVNGQLPPPPLNGSAHAWHHPIAVLDEVIALGGEPYGGVMPAWGAILNQQQRIAVIASFQNYWTDEIYATWLLREQASRNF